MQTTMMNRMENTKNRRIRIPMAVVGVCVLIIMTLGGCSFSKWFGFLPFVGSNEVEKPLRDYLVLGKQYFAQKKLDLALTEYNRAIHLYPEEAAPYHGRAWVYLEQGHYQAAEYDFDKAVSLDRGFAPSYLGRSLAREYMGDYPGAVKDLEWYTALEPKDQDAAKRLARLKQHPQKSE